MQFYKCEAVLGLKYYSLVSESNINLKEGRQVGKHFYFTFFHRKRTPHFVVFHKIFFIFSLNVSFS